MAKKSKIFLTNWGGLYPFDVLVVLGMDREEIFAWFKKKGLLLTEEDKKYIKMTGRGRTVMLPNGQTILWIKYMPACIDGVVAHEIFHVVSFLMEKIGVKYSFDSDEAFAYAIEYLTNIINKYGIQNLKN